MVKGVSVKFESYGSTIPKLLKLIKFDQELKRHDKVVIKPNLLTKEGKTPVEFAEEVIKFSVEHKAPSGEIFIAEGCDGEDTMEIFNAVGYKRLAEKYGVGLIDLNKAECEKLDNEEFGWFDSIMYPTILKDSFIVSLPKLSLSEKHHFNGSLSNMVGAFPLRHYKGFFSSRKNKLDSVPVKYQVHDIVRCRAPGLALIDASEHGHILIGQPLEMDKQAAKLLGIDWRTVEHLRLINETMSKMPMIPKEIPQEDKSEMAS